MNLIQTILETPELQEKPPILLDIGASGGLFPLWKKISPFSICLACDADSREISQTLQHQKKFKKFIFIDKIITENDSTQTEFFFTRFPFCSSRLRPLDEELAVWDFADFFSVEKSAWLPSLSLTQLFEEHQISYVDWIKIDSQGTDLRLFLSLKEEIIQKIFVADFEPGLLQAYEGEDYLSEVLQEMRKRKFWVSQCTIKGTRRISKTLISHKSISSLHPMAPGWAEIRFINTLSPKVSWTYRDFLLSWLFSTLQRQHGFALEKVLQAKKLFHRPLLDLLLNHSLFWMKRKPWEIPLIWLQKLEKRFSHFFPDHLI